MKTLVVGHCDGAHSMIGYFKKLFATLVTPDINFIFKQDPSETPDILIYSVFGNKHVKYNCKKILLCGGEKLDVMTVI